MDLGIKGRVALVSASSDGIGANAARRLAQEGAHLALFSRTPAKLEAVAGEIRAAHGVEVLTFAGDMTAADDIAALRAAIMQQFGRLDIAVLSTGRPPNPLRLAHLEDERARWDAAYAMLLRSVIELGLMASDLMRAGGWGRLVAVTSASVALPMPHHALSTVFRAGVQSWIAHIASELGRAGITANCVAPALISSHHRRAGAAYTAEQRAARLRMTPLGRMGGQDELSSAIAYLASAPAGFITGSVLRVDGGMGSALPL